METSTRGLTLPPVRRQWVERVMRKLGCECPPEVFDRIEVQSLPAEPRALKNLCGALAIGGKLLLAFTDNEDEAELKGLLEACRSYRDAIDLVRCRLLVIGPGAMAVAESLGPQAGEMDDCLHLHGLPPEDFASIVET